MYNTLELEKVPILFKLFSLNFLKNSSLLRKGKYKIGDCDIKKPERWKYLHILY